MKGSKPAGRRWLRLLFVTLVVILVAFAWLINYAYSPPSGGEELSWDRLYTLAGEGRIRAAKLLDEDSIVAGLRCTAESSAQDRALQGPGPQAAVRNPASGISGGFQAGLSRLEPCQPPVEAFFTSYPRSDVATQQLIERMTAGGTRVTIDKQAATGIAKLLVTFVFPLLILANLFGIILLSRGGDGSIGEIAGFGRLGRKASRKGQAATGVTFADVAGVEEEVAELREVTDYLKDPKKFEAYGAAAPKGVLLFGPPGCGKTLLARAVAGEAGVPFFSVSGAEFVESLVGVGAARVRDLFRQVREVAPAIVFIDEIDGVGRRRGGEGTSGGEREQTVNQLLIELDGFDVTSGIVLMGATNRPDILDTALLRPGRFDRHVTLEPPDLSGRQAILELHAKGKPISPEADFAALARRTPGFTGADLANVVNEGALLALREGPGTEIGPAHLSEAIQRVLHGPQRRGKLMTAEERKRIAFHEAGHALVATALGRGGEVQRVSIVARGRGLGASVLTEESERVLLTRTQIESSLAITMAGVAAENLVFGEPSTTGEQDIEKANALAREMIGVHGMSRRVGQIRMLVTEGGHLGSEPTLVEAVSGQTLAAFDEELKASMEGAEQTATELLTAHREQLEAVAEALESHETLEGPELKSLLASAQAGISVWRGNGRPPGPSPRGAAARRRT